LLAGHLLFGSLAGILAAACSWMAGLPLWVTVVAYLLAGGLGVLASVMVVVLRCHRASVPRTRAEAASPARTTIQDATFKQEAIRVVVERRQND
jgi:hypothetical protein